MQEGGSQFKNKDNADGVETAAMKTTPVEAADSRLMASGISTPACLNVIMCFKEKRDESNDKLKGITVEVIESFL